MAAMLSSLLLSLLITIGSWQQAFCKPSPGVWDFTIDKDKSNTLLPVLKSAYTDTQLSVTIICENEIDVYFNISWIFGKLRCVNFNNETDSKQALSNLLNPATFKDKVGETLSNYAKDSSTYLCSKHKQLRLNAANFTAVEETKKTTKESTQLPKDKEVPPKTANSAVKKRDTKPENQQNQGTNTQPDQDTNSQKNEDNNQQNQNTNSQLNQDTKPNEVPKSPAQQSSSDEASKSKDSNLVLLNNKIDHDSQVLAKVPQDGFYLMVMKFSPVNSSELPDDFKLKINIRISNGDSYIAAVDHPLLYFYGIMGLVYICYGIIWLFMLACNWRDLLRVQFWIGGVILLGMLEKAVFFAEYENINKTGQSVRGAIIFAELVSCLKRTLARMLVIIVSLGYGIVKPRLGQTFHKILLVGLVFFILASIEGCMRALADNADQSKQQLLPGVPLAVTDALIFFWIFTSLLQTTRTLRLRRNVVKLSLYRHFTNTLIFTILASVAFMIWSLTQHKFKNCLSDWKELWLDEAFWHLLFSIILIVIMILWRPTANNQRYAFSPLLDAAEDELDDDAVLSEAYDGMKMRSKTQQRNGGPGVNEDGKNEDDLKWVEENIPTSFADKLLPALDSDEEIMNTKFEVSKME